MYQLFEQEPLLIDARQVAALLDRSLPSVRRDDAAGRLPAPLSLGGSKKWRKAEIEAWVAAGCPGRARWTYQTNTSEAKR